MSQTTCSSLTATAAQDLEKLPVPYPGAGTREDPFVVDWDPADPQDPYNWSNLRKWLVTSCVSLSTFAVSFGSSSYSGGLKYTVRNLHVSDESAVLGISLYVLGFALGPLLFAPMGEMFGRRIVFLVTLAIYTPLQLGGALSNSLSVLLVCRLFSGVMGSSPLTNAGGVLTDIWDVRERGTASAIYAAVPFLGPIIGPIVGAFVSESHVGWHFNFWLIFIFGGISFLFTYFLCPETYAPVLIRQRATEICSGDTCYVSKYDIGQRLTFFHLLRSHFSRPFLFLLTEPIVMLFALYNAIVYGTVYALFYAYPMVFQIHRGWSGAQGGLAFIGVGVGISLGVYTSAIQNRLYWRAMERSSSGRAPPEARLHMAMSGAVLCPIGLGWFSLTAAPSLHWILPILAGVPFGMGAAQILQGSTNYLMDSYGIYVASATASTIVLRSIFAAIFPLFSPSMFQHLGDRGAMLVFFAFSFMCLPIPFLFHRYGPWIREKSPFACCERPALSPNSTLREKSFTSGSSDKRMNI